LEIEKKFLITEIPGDISDYKKYEIEQAYLCDMPTVRVRKRDDEYFLTIKSKPVGKAVETTLVNEEYEIPISADAYDHLLEKADYPPLSKTRYLVPLDGGLIAEVDVFHGSHEGLRFAEVEFPSLEAAEGFVKPLWFTEDVSSDRRYRNSELSKQK